jgi:hypothetical protein
MALASWGPHRVGPCVDERGVQQGGRAGPTTHLPSAGPRVGVVSACGVVRCVECVWGGPARQIHVAEARLPVGVCVEKERLDMVERSRASV